MGIQGTIVSATTPTTGSISKIYAPTTQNITSIAFGTNTEPHTSASSTNATLPIAAGSYLEGPIIQYYASEITVAYLEV